MPSVHTFCNTLLDSFPLNGKDAAQDGRSHSMTFLIDGGLHSCPIRPNFAVENGPASNEVMSGASVYISLQLPLSENPLSLAISLSA